MTKEPPNKPVYEFRPLPGVFKGDVLRYNGGLWTPDDGMTYDLAFCSGASSYGAPYCLMFEHSQQSNIEYSWYSNKSWQVPNHNHPRNNPWHYYLREGCEAWGGLWNREVHPNYIAGRSGMSKCSSLHSVANGLHIELKMLDKHIMSGLVREAATKRVLTLPDNPKCMYCGESPNYEELL